MEHNYISVMELDQYDETQEGRWVEAASSWILKNSHRFDSTSHVYGEERMDALVIPFPEKKKTYAVLGVLEVPHDWPSGSVLMNTDNRGDYGSLLQAISRVCVRASPLDDEWLYETHCIMKLNGMDVPANKLARMGLDRMEFHCPVVSRTVDPLHEVPKWLQEIYDPHGLLKSVPGHDLFVKPVCIETYRLEANDELVYLGKVADPNEIHGCFGVVEFSIVDKSSNHKVGFEFEVKRIIVLCRNVYWAKQEE